MQVSTRLRTRILLGLLVFGILAFSTLMTFDVMSKRETDESPSPTPTIPRATVAPPAPQNRVSPTPQVERTPTIAPPSPNLEPPTLTPKPSPAPTPRPLPTQDVHLPRGHYCVRYRNDTGTDITLTVIGAAGEESETLVPGEGKYRFWRQPTSVWLRFQSAGNGSLSDRAVWNPSAKSFPRSYDDLSDEERNSIPTYYFKINSEGKVQLTPE
jgi:hypothetical protein